MSYIVEYVRHISKVGHRKDRVEQLSLSFVPDSIHGEHAGPKKEGKRATSVPRVSDTLYLLTEERCTSIALGPLAIYPGL